MSLLQVDKDYLIIKQKLLSENETFLKKFQNNKDYMDYKKKAKKPLAFPIILSIVIIALIAGCVYFAQKYYPSYFVYEFVIGITLVLLVFIFLLVKLIKKIKQERAISKKGYFNAVKLIEDCYDNLVCYTNGANLNNLSVEEKIKFYEGLYKVFGNCSSKLSKVYSYKTRKTKKLNKSSLDWPWLVKYLYNFGKFCYNKKKDCKSFIELLKI